MEVLGRCSDPSQVQELYAAIEFIRKQRQIANLRRLTKYMEKEYNYDRIKVLYMIHDTYHDMLIVETLTRGNRGTKVGFEQEGYWIAHHDDILQEIGSCTNDWYCFVCHKAGQVVPCSSCPNAYHVKCMKTPPPSANAEQWFCATCSSSRRNKATKQTKSRLRECLSFIVRRLKSSFPDLLRKPSCEISPYYDHFVFRHYDLKLLHKRCESTSFATVEEFQEKIKLIHHNYCIALGQYHRLTKLTMDLLKECNRDLEELKLCRDCFYLSNTKPDEWFCKPCDPPHPAVWAKQRGFEFWPAKVIRVRHPRVDVRFFGKFHHRAWINKDSLRPFSCDVADLKINKRKVQWVQAYEECKKYIQNCSNELGENEAFSIADFNYNEYKALSTCDNANEVSELDISVSSSVEPSIEPLHIKKEAFVETDSGRKRTISNCSAATSTSIPPKILKTVDSGVQTESVTVNDENLDKLLSELKSDKCSCSLHYNVVIGRLKEYLEECKQLEISKLLKAATENAEIEKCKAVESCREECKREYEQKLKELKTKMKQQRSYSPRKSSGSNSSSGMMSRPLTLPDNYISGTNGYVDIANNFITPVDSPKLTNGIHHQHSSEDDEGDGGNDDDDDDIYKILDYSRENDDSLVFSATCPFKTSTL